MINLRDYIKILKKHEIMIASGLVIVAVFFLSIIFLLPNFNRARAIFSQQKLLQDRLERLSKKTKAINSIDYQYYRDIFPKINQVLPESKDYVSMFSAFDLLQSRTGVTILRTEFQLGVISTNSAKLTRTLETAAFVVPLSIELAGDISQLQKFLRSVSDLSGRLIDVDNIQLSLKKDGPITAKFNGKAYFYPLPTQIGSLEAP